MVGLIQFRDFKPRGEGAALCSRESSLRESPPPSRAMNLMEDKLLGEAEVPLNLVGLRTKLFMEFNLGRNSALVLVYGSSRFCCKLTWTFAAIYTVQLMSQIYIRIFFE